MSSAPNLGFTIPHPQGLSHPGARPAGCSASLTAGLGDKGAFFPLVSPPPLNAKQSLPALAPWGQGTEGEKGLACLALMKEGRRRETDLGMTLEAASPYKTALPPASAIPDHRAADNLPGFLVLSSFPADFPISGKFWM